MDEIIMRAENVTRRFQVGNGFVTALHGVNAEIPAGKLTVLRGRSGSGKTTLLNSLCGLDLPTDGDVYFRNQKLRDLGEHGRDDFRKKNIGIVFQSVAIISILNAYENVELSLRIAGVPPKDRPDRVMECLRLVGLEKRAKHKPFELSGGEQQRIAIARAIAPKPQILFADEPTAQLDSTSGLHIIKLFRSLVENEHITIVMTSHDPNIVDVADKVFMLSDGEIVNG